MNQEPCLILMQLNRGIYISCISLLLNIKKQHSVERFSTYYCIDIYLTNITYDFDILEDIPQNSSCDRPKYLLPKVNVLKFMLNHQRDSYLYIHLFISSNCFVWNYTKSKRVALIFAINESVSNNLNKIELNCHFCPLGIHPKVGYSHISKPSSPKQ